MIETNNLLNIENIVGIEDLEDKSAAQCSGGYVLRLYSDSEKQVRLKQNIRGDRNPNPDYTNDRRLAADKISVRGAVGTKYVFKYYPNEELGQKFRTVVIRGKGWGQEAFAKLNAPAGFTGFSINRIV